MIDAADIADALAAYLKAAPALMIPPDMIGVEWLPVHTVEQLTGRIWLVIVPRDETEELAARRVWEHTYEIALAIQTNVRAPADPDANPADAPIVDRAAIRQALAAGRNMRETLKTAGQHFAGAQLKGIRTETPWRPDHLADKATFTAVYTAVLTTDDDYTDNP